MSPREAEEATVRMVQKEGDWSHERKRGGERRKGEGKVEGYC